MKWFKHYSSALQSESLADLLRDEGLVGYARYWILLEHLASIFDGEADTFRIPIETVRGLFRIRSWTELDSFAERLATVRGLNVKRCGNVFEIKASILLELQDRDFKNARNKRGDVAPKKKIKIKDKELEKEGKKEPQISTSEILHPLILLWNSTAIKFSKVKKSNSKRDKKIESIWKQNTPDEWQAIITRLNNSDFCNGINDRGWKATFDWLMQDETHLKIMEGKYDNRNGKKRFGFERDDAEVTSEFDSIARGESN